MKPIIEVTMHGSINKESIKQMKKVISSECPDYDVIFSFDDTTISVHPQVSLYEYYRGQAMSGIISRLSGHQEPDIYERLANEASKVAKEMMKESECI